MYYVHASDLRFYTQIESEPSGMELLIQARGWSWGRIALDELQPIISCRSSGQPDAAAVAPLVFQD